jgi:hypothetical protein
MNEIDDLLQRIEVPPSDPADDVARGKRALRRRRRWQVTAAAASVVVLAGAGVAVSDFGSDSENAGFTDQPDGGVATHHSSKPHVSKSNHQTPRPDDPSQADFPSMRTVRPYRDVLDEHLDPDGDLLGRVSNVQGGSGAVGTKLDWNHGGMLELVIGPGWNAASGFYLLSAARMQPTTYDGSPARVSTAGADRVVSVQHADGQVVTLIASTSFGNNGTSTAATKLSQQQLLKAAADPRLSQ